MKSTTTFYSVDAWVAIGDESNKDYVQIGVNSDHWPGKSHREAYGDALPPWDSLTG